MLKIKSLLMFLVSWGVMINSFAADAPTEIIYNYYKNPKTKKYEKEVVALINMNQIFNKSGEGCAQHMTFAKISALQFSDSGNSIKLIQLKEKSGRVFAAPIKYQKLSNLEKNTAEQFFVQGNEYFIFYQVCGFGGFLDLINMYRVNGLLAE